MSSPWAGAEARDPKYKSSWPGTDVTMGALACNVGVRVELLKVSRGDCGSSTHQGHDRRPTPPFAHDSRAIYGLQGVHIEGQPVTNGPWEYFHLGTHQRVASST